MKTYNSYQEAKIANPKSDIYVWTGWKANDELAGPAGPFAALDGKLVTADCWIKCHPKDYCMTLEEFFDAGHEFVSGDSYLGVYGNVHMVGLGAERQGAIHDDGRDNKRYILRAQALEQAGFDTTPQQVGSLAGGDSEWKNGDILQFIDDEGEWKSGGRYIAFDAHVSRHVIMTWDGLFHAGNDDIRKPETPQQRQEREELEAAYELYCVGHKALQHEPVEFDVFSGLLVRERYLAIARETKYRKEEK